MNEAPRALKIDGLVQPIGGFTASPRLTWRYDGPTPRRFVVEIETEPVGRGRRREVVPGDSRELVWPGEPLGDLQRVHWRVGAELGGHTEWSAEAAGETAFSGEWPGHPITHRDWLSPIEPPDGLPELRTTVHLDAGIVSARLYIAGAGVVIPEINGAEVIRGQLEPGYANLDAVIPASAWDVTSPLRPGPNELTLRLGAGIAFVPRSADRYAKFDRRRRPVFVHGRLIVRTADGGIVDLATDADWQARRGSIRTASWYGGESTDPAFGSPWEPAVIVAGTAPKRWRSVPPIEVIEVLKPETVSQTPTFVVFDMGVNSAGRPLLTLTDAERGRTIRVTPAEILTAGKLDQSTTGTPIFDEYTPATAKSRWRPVTVYHGARYYGVEGLRGADRLDALEVEVMRAGNESVGSFSSSDPHLDRLHRIIDRAMQSNMYSVFTDCPHREKLGWLEQLHYVFRPLARGYDVHAHLTDMVRHMIDAQTTDGLIPNIAPELVVFDEYAVKNDLTAFRSDPNWGRALIDVPWNLHQHYGDPAPLRLASDATRRYLDYLERQADDDTLDFGLGDWIELDSSTPRRLVATHAWAQMLDLAAANARVLGEDDEAQRRCARASEVWRALQGTQRDRRGQWGSGSQGSLALAWSIPTLRDSERRSVYDQLRERILADGDALTIGETSLPALLAAFAANGDDADLHRLITRSDVPGYGLQLASDATALTESWEGAHGTVGVVSQNHFMLGAVDSWLIERVAGLSQSAGSVGWQSIRVEPVLLAGVESARTDFDSPRGRMSVSWRRGRGGRAEVSVQSPPSVEVDLRLPAGADLVPGPGLWSDTNR